MTNEELTQKMKKDMEMRGFSKYTYESYLNKTKDIIKYFKKPMEEVEIEELRDYLLKYLREDNSSDQVYGIHGDYNNYMMSSFENPIGYGVRS